ncbi:hypothetical protein [Burkholderia ubonensis]|uniref:hypothetical protein n=1 Tax=Burkholderia ubonensis TaxID=101571 RepID=UPI00075E92AD|nr:hypothetical protein [Burkholderia ubonensis]KVP17072.1 hypothetical protein WJ84_02005 [Burkholderia ubonensis]
MNLFFTRIDYMNLMPGNKTAGFHLAVSVPALQILGKVAVTEEERARVLEDAQERVRRSELLAEELIEDCGLELLDGSAIPRYFWVNRMFGGSLGANPDELDEVRNPERAQWMGPELHYTPHNVDAPKQALVLMILVQTWSEWAWGKIMVAEHTAARQMKGEGS